MNIVARYGIASVLTLFFILAITYGAILPFAKAKLYITTNQELRSGEINVDAFIEAYKRVFRFNSPVGNEETIYFWSTDVSSIIRSNPPPEITNKLLRVLEEEVDKTNMRQMVVLATTYEIAWRNHRIQEYADKAIEYYEQIKNNAPLLPQALYGLLRVNYELENNEIVVRLGNQILEMWPTDEKVINVLKEIESRP